MAGTDYEGELPDWFKDELSWSSIVRVLSHELRTPIAIIQTSAHLVDALASRLEPQPESGQAAQTSLQDHLATIRKNTEAITQLLGDLWQHDAPQVVFFHSNENLDTIRRYATSIYQSAQLIHDHPAVINNEKMERYATQILKQSPYMVRVVDEIEVQAEKLRRQESGG